MPNAFENKELAAAAGRKSGKSKKAKQWEALGEFITQRGAAKAMSIINKLPEDQYLDQYGKLLNYFKPRLQATQIDAKLEGDLNVKPIEWVGDAEEPG